MNKILESLKTIVKQHRKSLMRRGILIALIFVLAIFGFSKVEQILNIVLETDPLRNALSPKELWTQVFSKDSPEVAAPTPANVSAAKPIEKHAPPSNDVQACTLMGCSSRLVVELSGPYRWPQGEYEFRFDLDGKSSHCKIKTKANHCQGTIACEKPVSVMELCAKAKRSPKPSMAKTGFRFFIRGAPNELALTVLQKEKAPKKYTAKPKYGIERPNGDQCEPICRVGAITLKVKAR